MKTSQWNKRLPALDSRRVRPRLEVAARDGHHIEDGQLSADEQRELEREETIHWSSVAYRLLLPCQLEVDLTVIAYPPSVPASPFVESLGSRIRRGC